MSHQRPFHSNKPLAQQSFPCGYGQQPNTTVQSQPYYNGPRRPLQQHLTSVQCNCCHKPGHTIDKCYKLQRLRNDRGQNDRGRRLIASVQQSDSGFDAPDLASRTSTSQHTLTFEQHDQLLMLLSKQNMGVTPNLDMSQAAFLTGSHFVSLLLSQT